MILSSLYQTIIPQPIRKEIRDYLYYKSFQPTRKEPGNVLQKFDETKTLFFHIPKAGGISVIKSLYGTAANGFGHHPYEWYRRIYGTTAMQDYYKFTFVRNPYDRALSAFNFLKEGGMNTLDSDWSSTHAKALSSFEHFVLDYLNESTMFEGIHLHPQSYFLTNKHKEVAVDFVGKFENFHDDYAIVQSKVAGAKALEHHNKTKQKPKINFMDAYTDSMKAHISNLYSEDFELFGYTK